MNRTRKNIALVLALLLFFSCGGTAHDEAPEPDGNGNGRPHHPAMPVNRDTLSGAVVPKQVYALSRVLGLPRPSEGSLPFPNQAIHDAGLLEGDLQAMWDTGDGKVMMAFGDSFNNQEGHRTGYRSNTLAFTSDCDLSDGLTLDEVVGPDVKEIIDRQGAAGSIPTSGITVNGISYMHYMNVREWDTGGNFNDWRINFSEIAYSTDGGRNWILSGVKWGADTYFAQVCFLREHGQVYLFGTCAGRYGHIRLARVNENKLLDKDAYEYWNSRGWSRQEKEAVPLVWSYSGEMSVVYNSYYKRYLMTYLTPDTRIVALRDAEEITGDWSGEHILFYNHSYDEVYGPNFYPWNNDRAGLYFVLSYSQPAGYAVNLLHSDTDYSPQGFNLLNDPGFEDEIIRKERNGQGAWKLGTGVEITSTAVTGSVACKLLNEDASRSRLIAEQAFATKKNTDYTVTCWVTSSIDKLPDKFWTQVSFMTGDGKLLLEPAPERVYHTTGKEWVKVTRQFNSGDNPVVLFSCGTDGQKGLSVIVDDFKAIRSN